MSEKDITFPPITKGSSFNMAVEKKYATKSPTLALHKHNSNCTSDDYCMDG